MSRSSNDSTGVLQSWPPLNDGSDDNPDDDTEQIPHGAVPHHLNANHGVR